MSLTRATLASDNTVYAQLILDIGPDAVCKTAKLLGITTKLDCYPAEGLGGLTRGVTTLEMAERLRHSRQRWRAPPADRDRAGGVPRRQEREAGQHQGQAGDDRRPGLRGHQDPQEERDRRGTGTAANYGCPAAGKTGTTDEAKDAWFVGYTPELSAAVWVGYPDAGVAMPGAQGGTYAAPVWHAFMSPAHGDFCEDLPLARGAVRGLALLRQVRQHRRRRHGRLLRLRLRRGYTEDPRTRAPAPQYDPNLYESPPQGAPDVAGAAEAGAAAATYRGTGGTGGGVTPGDG